MRVGIGYDVHRLVAGRELALGGVKIPFEKGLEGHSDADVLCHAIADALLGAAGLGDIGRHFPDDDPQYKGISSLTLLGRVNQLLSKNGFCVGNIDAVLLAERPKIAPYSDTMRARIASALATIPAQVSIKATTSEGLGFAGRGEGMAAMATVLLLDKKT